MLKFSISEPTPQETFAARWALEHYLKLLPKDPNALSSLADLLASDYLNRWNEAENYPAAAKFLIIEAEQRVRQVLEINNTLAKAHYANGLVLRAQANYRGAEQEFANLVTRYPNSPAALAQQGNERINQGDFNGGLKPVQQAITRDSSSGIFYWIQGEPISF